MDNHQSRNSWQHALSLSAVLVAVALGTGSPAVAQQHQQRQELQRQASLAAPFAKSAFLSLLAIESEDLAGQDRNDEAAQMTATEKTIEIAKAEAATREEENVTEMLGRIYSLKLRDNDLLRAYQKVMEIENAQDADEATTTRRKKDDAISQIADSIESITKRENACFGQLEESLRERSTEDVPACSEWILRGKLAGKLQAQSATSDETILRSALSAGAQEISRSIQNSQER